MARKILGRLLRFTLLIVSAVVFGPIMLLAAWLEGFKQKKEKPRIFWGPHPLINIKYHSQAVKQLGYHSTTVVDKIFAINSEEDFDVLMTDLLNESLLFRCTPRRFRYLVAPYRTFLWALPRFDIYNLYFLGGMLYETPLKYWEMSFLRLAGKKTVFTAFGADVQIMSRFHSLLFKHAQNVDYPDFTRQETMTLRNVEVFSRQADYIIAGVDWVDYMPRWNKLVSAHFAIDTGTWKPSREWKATPVGKTIKVLHAPNHRTIKGTNLLIEACQQLKEEGVPIELVVVERAPNSRVRELIEECDIVADQFIVGWYAMFALEGMSMGKPVLTYLRPDLLELYTLYSWAGECPLVNTHPMHIKETLRELVANPELREELGKKGRAYVEKHHSLESIGQMFDEIYRELWTPGKAGRASSV